MKRSFSSPLYAFSFLLFLMVSHAQTLQLPVVTVTASDPIATRAGDPAEFTFLRQGSTNAALNVFFYVFGTAVNGIDYTKVSNWLTIPAGERSAVLKIQPLDSGQQVGVQTVDVQLDYSPMMPPINYIIGEPRSAEAYITDPRTGNLPPVVRIVSPPNGKTFAALANITIAADAFDLDTTGYVHTVEFFAGSTSLGITTNNPESASPVNPFSMVWSNVPPGQYTLTARATDNQNAMAISSGVNISVVTAPEPMTMVEIIATQPYANEPCNGQPATPGAFTVFRNANTNVDLDVTYAIRGTASNGADYELLPGTVTIPKGEWSIQIPIIPLADTHAEGTEAVALALATPICATVFPPPPDCYFVGMHSHDVLYIRDCQAPSNLPPIVRITSPPNGTIFRTPVDLPIFAYAHDPDGRVQSVEFFADDKSLGTGSIMVPPTMPWLANSNMYIFVWSNAPVGSWTLKVKATDDLGTSITSAPVTVSLMNSVPPPPVGSNIVVIVASDPIAIEGTNCWPWLGVTNGVASWTNWMAQSCKFFTNCGPKNATFTVRRAGPTNDSLTVLYQVGGTATNGIDYVELPGTITIPAGERRAFISVVPLDSGAPHTNATVVIKLGPSGTYLRGWPRAAAALIIDSQQPTWTTGMLPGGLFHLNTIGPDGAWFHVEYSTNLMNWMSISTNQVVNGAIDFIDPDASADLQRFYRAVPETAIPVE